MVFKNFSDASINRLTLYHCILVDLIEKNINRISINQIASTLKIEDSAVREDIETLGNVCGENDLYDVIKLKSIIEETLGFKKNKKAFIVGAGNLGIALANYEDFQNYGISILALFDCKKEKIGTTVNNKLILDINKLPNIASKSNIDMVILAVPRSQAQMAADIIIKSNIKLIWNFTSVILSVPDEVEVLNENMMTNFLEFVHKL